MEDVTTANYTPQTGVLCIDVARQLLDLFPNDNIRSYISASYVKFLRNAGADVVPVWIGRNRDYYVKILKKINGLLIPGGAVNFEQSPESKFPNDCVQASMYIYEIAKELNDSGNFFPIWGTCLGYQLLIYHSANEIGSERRKSKRDVRIDCTEMDCSLPARFEEGFRESKMFSNLTENMKEIMETEAFCCHYHRYCITRERLLSFDIDEEWKILATNQDKNGLEFITFIEHKKYPFYGTQVHLERIANEFMGEHDTCSHTKASIEASNYFANFFISECRKCRNRFDSKSEMSEYSIGNFDVKNTRNHPKSHWSECYVFGVKPKYAGETDFDVD